MPPGMALIVTLRGSNYRCLEQIFMVPKGFKPSKFDCILKCCLLIIKFSRFRFNVGCCTLGSLYKTVHNKTVLDIRLFIGASKSVISKQKCRDYNTVRYNMAFDITQFKDGSQKCIDYIEK